jgi:broad specificity phosphatase PhoE
LIGRQLGLRPQGWLELCERGYCMTEPGLPRVLMRSRYPGVDLPPSADALGWARHWKSETMEALARRMAKVARQLEVLSHGEVETPAARAGAAKALANAASAPASAPATAPATAPAAAPTAPTTIALVVHWTSCSMLLRHLLGVAADSDVCFAHDNCGISMIRIAEEGAVLCRLNDTRHLVRAGLLAATVGATP